MASPLTLGTNARIALVTRGQRLGPEEGYRITEGARILVVAMLGTASQKTRAEFLSYVDAPIAMELLDGYVIGWMPLAEGDDYKTIDYKASPDYNATGLRPPAMVAGQSCRVAWSGREGVNARVVSCMSKYGDEGIGAIMRKAVGDPLVIQVEWMS